MTTISFPAVGTGGFSEAKWAEYFDGDDGIINDYAGTSLLLTRINTGEIARYSVGSVRVAGYVLKVTANHDLTVSTAAATYYTWACYDPALNIAGGGGVASAAGPCTLGISSGLPDPAGSKQYCLLDKIVRSASQALTATTVTDLRRHVGPSVYMKGSLPAGDLATPEVPTIGVGPYPLGTRLYAGGSDEAYDRVYSGGVVKWQARSKSADFALPLASAVSAFDAAPFYYLTQGQVHLKGNLKRTDGARLVTTAGSADVLVATMPTGFRPASIRRFPVAASNGVPCRVKVEADGQIFVYADKQDVDWVDLSNVQFHRGA